MDYEAHIQQVVSRHGMVDPGGKHSKEAAFLPRQFHRDAAFEGFEAAKVDDGHIVKAKPVSPISTPTFPALAPDVRSPSHL